MALIIGEVPGHPIGSEYDNRMAARPIHPYTMQGIHGNRIEGAGSIVLNGGYVEDEDFGSSVIYTGEGLGRDQSLESAGNAALVRSQLDGLPVRVIRGPKGDPSFSPNGKYRYDGLFRVVEYWPHHGSDGYLKWRFRLDRIDSTPDAPGFGETDPALPPGSEGPVGHKVSTIQRQVRNTAVTEAVKKLYDWRCQICGLRLELPGGFAYAEGAHIRPLGKPHLGGDVVGNVLCLCPTDHVRLDRGALIVQDDLTLIDRITSLPIGKLLTLPGHPLDVEYIRYHRDLWNTAP